MDFQTAVKTCLSKYVVWQGRASRSEYWWFYLFCFLVVFAIMVVGFILGAVTGSNAIAGLFAIVGYLVDLALFLPSLSVLVRRLHDTNRSGWWFWICLIPFIGAVVLLVFMVLPGTQGENRYGSDPLGPGAKVFE